MISWMLPALLLAATAPPCAESPLCRCLPFTQEEAAERADAIFMATVVSVRALPRTEAGWTPPGSEVRLRLHAAWKGIESPSPEVVVINQETSCDFDWAPGDRYLVYGQRDSTGAYTADYCSGTRLLTPGAENLEALGEPSRSWLDPDPENPR
jgi:hypothetical protein